MTVDRKIRRWGYRLTSTKCRKKLFTLYHTCTVYVDIGVGQIALFGIYFLIWRDKIVIGLFFLNQRGCTFGIFTEGIIITPTYCKIDAELNETHLFVSYYDIPSFLCNYFCCNYLCQIFAFVLCLYQLHQQQYM